MLAQFNSSNTLDRQWPSRRIRFQSIALLGFGMAIGSAASVGQPARQQEMSIDQSRIQVLRGHQPQWANPQNDEGSLPSTHMLPPLTLVLSRSSENEAAFEKLLSEQQDSSSPNYHHWLNPTEVGERFGRSAQDISSVKAWLESHNLHVDWISPSRAFIGFSGNAGDVGAAFQTEFHYYQVNDVIRFAASSEPGVRIELAPFIKAVRGLYQVDAQPMHRFKSLSSASPEFTDQSFHFLTPQDFSTIYDLGQSAPVTGQSIGIVGVSRTDPADFTNFVALTGAKLVPPTEIVPTAFGGVDPGPAFTAPRCRGFASGPG